jgi:hypothetical protein
MEPTRRTSRESVDAGPRLRRARSRWSGPDRLFLRVLLAVGTIAALGVAVKLLVDGDTLGALLMVGAVLYVLGVGPLRHLLDGHRRRNTDDG